MTSNQHPLVRPLVRWLVRHLGAECVFAHAAAESVNAAIKEQMR